MSKKENKAAKSDSEASYLKSDEIGLVIAKGMATLYREKPQNPVDYLGKWLLNVAQVHRSAAEQQNQIAEVQRHIDTFNEAEKARLHAEAVAK